MSWRAIEVLYLITYTIIIASIGSIINYFFIRKYRNKSKLSFVNCFFMTSAIIHIESVIIYFLLYTYNIFWLTSYLFCIVFAWMVEKLLLEKILKVADVVSSKKFIVSGIVCIVTSSIIEFIQVEESITANWVMYNNFDWVAIVINLLLMTFCIALFFVFAHFAKEKNVKSKVKLDSKHIALYSGEDLSGKEVKKLLRKYCMSDNVIVEFVGKENNIKEKTKIDALIKKNSIYDVKIDNNTNNIFFYIEDKC